jgi:hypothetical protein
MPLTAGKLPYAISRPRTLITSSVTAADRSEVEEAAVVDVGRVIASRRR